MTWPIVVLVLGAFGVGCAFAALQRFLAMLEKRQGHALEERLGKLEEELQRTLRALSAGAASPLRKAGY
jgi:hypothetical protein